MNFQNLEYFITVARERNITKAADELGISQQALSNQISRIEAELGCRLFNRQKHFELTPSGRYFLDSANQILDINRQTESAINDINNNQRGELKIGIPYTRGQAILPLLLPEFNRKYPLVSISIMEASTSELELELARGSIDLLIGYKPFMLETAVTTDLFTEHLNVAVPKALLQEKYGDAYDSFCASYRKSPDLRLLKDLPFVLLKKGDRVRGMVDQEFYRLRISPEIKLETENIQTSFALVAGGLGVGIYPDLYLNSRYITFGNPNSEMRDKVELFRFCNNPKRDTITIAIGYDDERYLSQIAQDFINLAVNSFRRKK